jgi:hypothetical protein
MLAATSPQRATLGMLIVDPGNAPAIHLNAPFITAAFRHPDVGTRTAFGLAARQRQFRYFIEAETPAGERTNGCTSARLNPDTPVVPAISQFLQLSTFIAVSRSSPDVLEHENGQNCKRNKGNDKDAVLGHVILFQACSIAHTPMPAGVSPKNVSLISRVCAATQAIGSGPFPHRDYPGTSNIGTRRGGAGRLVTVEMR